jgi:hypothetical protein
MTHSPLFGRRIHIAGCIDGKDIGNASADAVKEAREFVSGLVRDLMKKGATFVVPVDTEPLRPTDNLPICFDWLVWQGIMDNIVHRPKDAPLPLAIAVQHHKTEAQIPPQFHELWDNLRNSDFVRIENAAHWNMGSKRMETQARWGDILIPIGGSEGVLYLSNLYHEVGKPVVPLNFPICADNVGAKRLFSYGLTSSHTHRLFQTIGATDPHGWINRINFPGRKPVAERVTIMIELLESLARPKAFAVRLLNEKHEDFKYVDNFFVSVVKPIISGELGYDLVVIDGERPFESASVVQDIFSNLHKSSVVIADITGLRPNCFIEFGYALGRGIPTMLTAKDGVEHPFDVSVFSGHHWDPSKTVKEQQEKFRTHWNAIKNRAAIVPSEPLVP